MFRKFCAILIIAISLQWRLIDCAPAEVGKNKEKVRAYEFGYSVEENQHRHEKRDENGIVMGEFGFITGDGIYHVTVYATDENGKFKILAMRSYPYSNPEKKMITSTPPAVQRPMIIKPKALDTPSCGGCIITEKLTPQKKPGDQSNVFRPLSKPLGNGGVNGVTLGQQRPQQGGISKSPNPSTFAPFSSTNTLGSVPFKGALPKGSPTIPSIGNQLTSLSTGRPALQLPNSALNSQNKGFAQTTPFGAPFSLSNRTPNNINRFVSPQQHLPQQNIFKPNTATITATLQNAKESGSRVPQQPITQNRVQPPLPNTFLQTTANIRPQSATTNAFPRPQLSSSSLGIPAFNRLPPPVLPQSQLYGQLQNFGAPQSNRFQLSNQPLLARPKPSFINGAKTTTTPSKLTPSGQSIGKITPTGNGGGGPLYRFNYVLDYNSHREEGRIDGSKEGNYQTIDKDGIRRIIDYIANENGYQPHIRWERVPPNQLPSGENKLKQYEFVWFNLP